MNHEGEVRVRPLSGRLGASMKNVLDIFEYEFSKVIFQKKQENN